MKKRYNRPVSKVIKINEEELLTGSPGISDDSSDTSKDNLAKRNRFLEDDLEDLDIELQH